MKSSNSNDNKAKDAKQSSKMEDKKAASPEASAKSDTKKMAEKKPDSTTSKNHDKKWNWNLEIMNKKNINPIVNDMENDSKRSLHL